MRYDFLLITIADRRLWRENWRHDYMKKIGQRRWEDAASKYADIREFAIKEPNFLIRKDPKLWLKDRIEDIARRRTLAMIKKLRREERKKDAKFFLDGILKNKNFYTYYRRADNKMLYSLINKLSHDLINLP